MIHTTFYIRRLHSLCGLLALGIFLCEHIITNSEVLISPDHFNAAVAFLASIPAPIMMVMELMILATFGFHAIYGIYIVMQAKNNPQHYGFVNNWFFWLQRITAVIIILFLIWHVVYLRIMVKGGGTPITFELLQAYFANPVIWAAYLIAMIASIFHLFNGITTFCMTWGIAKGPRIQKVISCLSMIGFALLSLLTLAFMIRYWM